MKRMLANKRGQNVQGSQCCFQALEVLVHLKNSKHKKMKPDICQTDSPGARIPVLAVFQVQGSRKHCTIPPHGWNWSQCLCCGCRRGCERSLSAAPHLPLLLGGSAGLGSTVLCSYQDFLCSQQKLQPVLVSLLRDLNAAVCRPCSAFSPCTFLPK